MIRRTTDFLAFRQRGTITQPFCFGHAVGGTALIWHDGGNGYFYADFRRYIDEKVVYIVATNSRISPFRDEYSQLVKTICR